MGSRSWWAVFGGGVVCSLVGACSADNASESAFVSDKTPDGSMGSGGSPSNGSGGAAASAGSGGVVQIAGGSSGLAGTGGTASIPKNPGDVCVAYALAFFRREFTCAGIPFPDHYDDDIESCPDLLFSPGSTRTIEGTLACIEQWNTFPCDDYARGLSPPCATPGTRQPGESCYSGMQCTSGRCYATAGQCGTCTTQAAHGGNCGDTNTTCEQGQECVGTTCVNTVVPGDAGASCTTIYDCKFGLACVVGTGGKQCGKFPGDGEPCYHDGASLGSCAKGARCDVSDVCRNLPSAGAPCLRSDDTTAPPSCALDAYCDGTMCQALPHVGAPCVEPVGEIVYICARDAICRSMSCVPRLAAGVPCGNPSGQGDCVDGLICGCPPVNGRADYTCTTGTCQKRLHNGDSCTEANTVCSGSTECKNGVCSTIQTATEFASLCGL